MYRYGYRSSVLFVYGTIGPALDIEALLVYGWGTIGVPEDFPSPAYRGGRLGEWGRGG